MALATALVIAIPVTGFAMIHSNQPPVVKEERSQTQSKKTKKVASATSQPQNQPEPSSQQPNTQPQPTTQKKPTPAPGNNSQQPSKFPPKRSQPFNPPPPAVFSTTINTASFTQAEPALFDVSFTTTVHQGQVHHMTVYAQIVAAPPSGEIVRCFALMNANYSGFIRVYIPESAPNGQYICRLQLNETRSVQTDQFSFTVTDDSVTAP